MNIYGLKAILATLAMFSFVLAARERNWKMALYGALCLICFVLAIGLT